MASAIQIFTRRSNIFTASGVSKTNSYAIPKLSPFVLVFTCSTGITSKFSAWHPQFFHFCGCQALKHRVAPNRPVFWHHFDHFEGIFNINLLVMPARDKLWPLDKLTACHSRPERGRKRPKRSNSVQTVLASPNYFNNPSTDSPIICSSFASPKFSSTVAPTVPKLSTSGSSPKPSMEREYAKNGTFSLV